MQKIAKTAIKILKGAIANLPSTVKLVEISRQVLPMITRFFRLR
ncbi:hypothetical protein [Nostoc sp. DSM 114161]|jgi:hypothetical protein